MIMMGEEVRRPQGGKKMSTEDSEETKDNIELASLVRNL